MIEKFVEVLITQQLNAGMITKENISVYRYGYILMFEVSINILIAFIIGYFFHELPIVIFFLFMFIPLRSYCGGYHTPKAWMCIILSNIFIVCVLLTTRNIYLSTNYKVIVLLEIFCIVLIIVLAPIQSTAKKVNNNEKQLYKKYIKLILVIQVILGIIFFAFELNEYGQVIIMSHIIQALALVISHYSNIKKNN